MNYSKRFFTGLLAFILVLVITGGLGYVGYSFLFTNQSGQNTSNSTMGQNEQMVDTSKNAIQGQQNISNTNTTQQTGNGSNPSTNSTSAISQASTITKNKETLTKSISKINESLKDLTLDPYSTTTMANMGTKYDSGKMEQLHSGLYKISVGMALLNQLNSDIASQSESANLNIQNAVAYYSNQYNLTVQNKNKLSKAMVYVNDAAGLVNINPYISSNGVVYDKDRMD